MSDDGTGNNGPTPFKNGDLSSTDGLVKSLWQDCYTIIRRSNLVIANKDNADIDQALSDRFGGEAQFFRAYAYYLLVFNWGDVPYTDKPLELGDALGRTEKATVIANMVADLDDAASKLPNSYSAPNIGRVTKGAAKALRARVLLYSEQYAEAAVESKEIIDLGVYDLFQDTNGFGYASVHQLENENNEEVIFDLQYVVTNDNGNAVGSYEQTFIHPTSGWGWSAGWSQGLQPLVDDFETYDATTDAPTVIDPLNPLANRDPRLDMAMAFEGDVINGKVINPNGGRSGYYPGKRYQESFVGQGSQLGYNLVLMRYAEVLLTYAEAKIESGAIDSSVLDAINKVRARAYGTVYTDIANYPEITTTDQAALRAIVRNERRVELCFESDFRLMDIRRWRIAEDVLNGNEIGTGGRILRANTFDAAKHYVWPIPQSEIDIIGADVLLQNPNY
jgi:hypothetical protein